MNERIKIGVLGAMNTGKTTLIDSFKDHSEIAIVRESARDFFTTYPAADRTSLSTMFALQKMIRSREAALQDSGKILLTDRTIIDPIIYAMYYGNINVTVALLNHTIEHIASYTHFALCSPEGIPFKQEGVRSEEDRQMRVELHGAFIGFLESNNLDYTVVTGNKEERRKKLIEIMEHE